MLKVEVEVQKDSHRSSEAESSKTYFSNNSLGATTLLSLLGTLMYISPIGASIISGGAFIYMGIDSLLKDEEVEETPEDEKFDDLH
jgi:hypothetical protein